MENNQPPTYPQLWEANYTPAQVETIKKNWVTPPSACRGNCELKGTHGYEHCTACGWDNIGNDF